MGRFQDETLCRSVDEVVEAILFAADPENSNSFMTGSAICVDGGITTI